MRTPFRTTRTTLSALLVALAAGCSGDDPVDPMDASLADLAGSWIGTGFSITSKANPALRVDLVELGGNMSWAIRSTGTFSGTAVLPGGGLGQPGTISVPLSGVLRLVDDATLRVDFVPEIPPMFNTFIGTFQVVGDVLTIEDDDETQFDFDGDGKGEPAILRVSLRKI